jgi:hypothetical protein
MLLEAVGGRSAISKQAPELLDDSMAWHDPGRARLRPSRLGMRLAGRLALPESRQAIETLASAGVHSGDLLRLQPEFTAG